MYKPTEIAQGLAALGRGGDTALLHVAPEELQALQGLGSLFGRRLTVNPHTGLPEAFAFLALIPLLAGGLAAKGAAAVGLGKLATMAVSGLAGAATGAITSAVTRQNPLLGALAGGLGGLGGKALGSALAGLGSGKAAATMALPAAKATMISPAAKAITPALKTLGTEAIERIPGFAKAASAAPATTPVTAPASGLGALFTDEGFDALVDAASRPSFYLPTLGALQLQGLAAQQGAADFAERRYQDFLRANRAQNERDFITAFGSPRVFSSGGHIVDGYGDGMSDHVPATIEGREPVRLARGEFVWPADVVSALGNGDTASGAEYLDAMINRVRQAAHGKAKQVNQNAGKLAFSKAVERKLKHRR